MGTLQAARHLGADKLSLVRCRRKGPSVGDVLQLFRDAAFDPETVKTLCAAYDKARASLHDKGQPDIVNEVIARRIIALAKEGERDPDRLCAGALSGWLGSRLAEN